LINLVTTQLFHLYFRAETSPKAQHAIRRHRYAAVTWNLLHFPLTASIVCFGSLIYGIIAIKTQKKASYTKYINDGYLEHEFQSILGTQLAIIHWCLAAMQLCHLDNTNNTTNVSAKGRIIGRTIAGIIFFVIGWTVKITPTTWIFITAGLLTFGVIFEEYGGVIKKKKCPNNQKDKKVLVIVP
jgi:low temperature requirement protein LtrA